MITLDDLITKYRKMSTKGNVLFPKSPDMAEKINSQYKEAVACLEELKSLKDDYAKGMQSSYATFMYNKGVDDFAGTLILTLPDAIHADENDSVFKLINNIAKQLKEAKQSEN